VPLRPITLNHAVYNIYTVSQKKFPPLNLSVALSNLNRFSIFLHRWKAVMWQYPPHLRHVATLPWEIKNSIFSADVKENANKLHSLIASYCVINHKF